jgi:hypothetical protein
MRLRDLKRARELAHAEGLDDLVVGAELEAPNTIDLVAFAVTITIAAWRIA